MTCGDGSFGALGHGDWNSVARPKLIEQLLRSRVCSFLESIEHVIRYTVCTALVTEVC
jgi:hypothetical protein